MVKVSAFQPKLASDRTKGKKAATITPKGSGTRSCKSTTPLDVDLPTCNGCGQIVGDDVRALQCDCCQSTEAWRCAECLNMPAELYDMLVTKGGSSLKWFCDKCNLSMAMIAGMMDQQKQMEDKLSEMTNRLEKRIDDMVMSTKNGKDRNGLEEKIN